MSRLDHHVALVQNKLAFQKFVNALAWAVLWAGVAACLGVVVWRVIGKDALPSIKWWAIGAGAIVVGAGVFAFMRRPSEIEAAVAIDERLGIKEKFSTALSVRSSKDPFAQATVRDAEQTASNVQLQRQFPVQYPRVAYFGKAAIALAVVLALWMKPLDLFGSQQAKKVEDEKKQQELNKALRQADKALALVKELPPSLANDPKLKTLADNLGQMMKEQKFEDPSRLARKAQEVLQDTQKALADEAKKVEQKVMEQERTFTENFGDPSDYKSQEVKKIDEALAKGKFDKAVKDFGAMAEKFNNMTEEEKQQLAKDVGELAKKLENAGQNPNVQQEIERKLQEMGASAQQAQQMAQQMQQAAQGNKQAQQQLGQQVQQMQQQLQQQMQQLQQQAQAGNQQAQQQLQQLQQQQQAIQQAIQGMQGQANAQAQAQQMSQAAQQMANAMQQSAGQQQQGQQQAQGKAGQQQGAQGNPQQAAQQQMAQAQAQMQQAVQSMQAAQADAQQVAAAQASAMKQAGQNGKGQGSQGQGGKGQGEDGANGVGEDGQASGQPVPGDQGKEGEFANGDPNQNQGGNGPGGPGIANGGQTRNKAAAGYGLKTEHDIGQENKDGKILANMLIKDNQPIKGSSKLGLAQVTESVQKQQSDEVDEDHVSGQSRKAAEEYFRTMKQDAQQAPAPASK
jgi:hypothetical protein